MEVNEGEIVVFTCSASGVSAPEIMWLQNGSPFNQDTESRVIVNPPSIVEPSNTTEFYLVVRTLVLQDVRDADSGDYTCVAAYMNILQSNTTFTFELFVRGMIFSQLIFLSYEICKI